jgi:hypothetical protein
MPNKINFTGWVGSRNNLLENARISNTKKANQ